MNTIIQNYKSRQILLELLKKRGYIVEEYEGFSVNEIDTMTRAATLDMFLTTVDSVDYPMKKIYIKYEMNMSTAILDNTMNDLFENAQEKYKLRPGIDTLVIVSKDNPNDKMQSYLVNLFETRQIFVTIINIHRLQFNILEHELQPREIFVLTESEKIDFMRKFNISNIHKNIPEISRFDPLALALFLKPGDVCRFVRDSPVAISADYYRVTV